MKPIRFFFAAACAALLFAGCAFQRVFWSPDGKQAVVLAEKGLYLCDSEGRLSGLLVPEVRIAAWFPDSAQVALVVVERFKTWSDLKKAIPQPSRIENLANTFLKGLDRSIPWAAAADAFKKAQKVHDREWSAIVLFLRDERAEDAKKAAGPSWSELANAAADADAIRVGKLAENKIELGPAIVRDLCPLTDLRVSPSGTGVVFTVERAQKQGTELWLADSTGKKPAVEVQSEIAGFPDWEKSSGALVFIRAVGTTTSDDQLRLGVVTRQQLLKKETGEIAPKNELEEMAGVIFDPGAKVRCLADGRILFSAAEIKLPGTSLDMPKGHGLFALDLARQATVISLIPPGVRPELPENLNFFEVSPDEKQISVAGDKGVVAVFTIASGQAETIQPPIMKDLAGIPNWRAPNELCFFRQPTETNRVEIALWKSGGTRILSKDWPEEVRKGLLDP